MLERQQQEISIQVLELGIKPQDFTGLQEDENGRDRRRLSINLYNKKVRDAYLRWYPVIAACSFIRANKSAPFASEYIIPQLIMQWLRKQSGENHLMGIRYFSCASVRASELGYDYVFPASNFDYNGKYCTILRESFSLTEPVCLRDFDNMRHCQQKLNRMKDLQKI